MFFNVLERTGSGKQTSDGLRVNKTAGQMLRTPFFYKLFSNLPRAVERLE
jgi:hypothetical protein